MLCAFNYVKKFLVCHIEETSSPKHPLFFDFSKIKSGCVMRERRKLINLCFSLKVFKSLRKRAERYKIKANVTDRIFK